MAYKPPPVSKYFEKDWQFAVAMSKLPLLRPASIVISIMPLIIKASKLLFNIHIVEIPLSMWITWWASVLFIASWVIIQVKCPYLIRHYRTYGEFEAERHSHRWLVWLFYLKVPQYRDWQKALRETIAKEISIRARSILPPECFRVCPYVVKTGPNAAKHPFPEPSDIDEVRLFYPENIGRDLYVPFICDGDRWLLLLQETDPELSPKAKELFWLHYSAVTKALRGWRVAFWALFYASVGLLAFNVLCNVKLVFFG